MSSSWAMKGAEQFYSLSISVSSMTRTAVEVGPHVLLVCLQDQLRRAVLEHVHLRGPAPPAGRLEGRRARQGGESRSSPVAAVRDGLDPARGSGRRAMSSYEKSVSKTPYLFMVRHGAAAIKTGARERARRGRRAPSPP